MSGEENEVEENEVEENEIEENEIEESSVHSSKRTKTSVAWDCFVKFVNENGVPKAKCKYCGKEYVSRNDSGTSNMKKHVRKCPGDGEISSYPPLDQEEYKDKISKMEGRLADELYAESLQLSKLQLTSTSADDQENKLNDFDGDDLSLWDGSDDKLDSSADLDREWQRRHDQFHTIGYRDGLIAGKEASAQEGFNIGFKQSVHAGYGWGAVRGVTSAFSHLPQQLKERLIEIQDKRNEFHGLYESVHSLSTTDALKLFSEEIKAQEALEQSEHLEGSHHTAGLEERSSHGSQLRNYSGQLESLICDSPAIDIHLPEPK